MTTDIHSCSLYCDRPGCIKAQRDQLRDERYVPLTEEEVDAIFDPLNEAPTMQFRYLAARAIERKHGIGVKT